MKLSFERNCVATFSSILNVMFHYTKINNFLNLPIMYMWQCNLVIQQSKIWSFKPSTFKPGCVKVLVVQKETSKIELNFHFKITNQILCFRWKCRFIEPYFHVFDQQTWIIPLMWVLKLLHLVQKPFLLTKITMPAQKMSETVKHKKDG